MFCIQVHAISVLIDSIGRKVKFAFQKWDHLLTLYLPVTKIAEFANSVDLDEVAHNEPPHLDLHCLPSSL